MGSIVKGVASAFGGRKRRREQKAANKEFDQRKDALGNFEFGNYYGDLEGVGLDASQAQGYDATFGQAGTLGDAAQAQMGQLGRAQGYDAVGYESQGYDAERTNVGQLLRGQDTGLSNTMNNLQVSTAGAEMAAREADQSLAASQDLAAQAGSGAGGATALAAAAAKSKSGISADIDRQVKSNEAMRAQAESQLQQGQLAQQNLASKFDLGQQQFNVGEGNQAARFGAQAANDAARFGADAQNQAARFGAQANNQFALESFGAQNQMNQFNVGNQNKFGMAQFDANNRFGELNMGAANDANRFGADQMNKFMMQNQQQMNHFMLSQAQGQQQRDENMWGQNMEMFNIAAGRKSLADQARAKATGDLVGGIGAVADIGVKALTGGLSDRRAKKDIKLISISPSGLNIYSFRYKDTNHGEGLFQGVMSDEIPSYAVQKHKDGYEWVDYSKIDVEFKLIK